MINNPQVPSVLNSTDTQSKVASRIFGRAAMATALMMAAIAALAVTSLVQSNERATARSSDSVLSEQSTSTSGMPMSVPLDSGEVGPFAFGYLVFENDPADGVAGFGPLPPRAPAQ